MEQGKCRLCRFQVDGFTAPELVAFKLEEHMKMDHQSKGREVMEVTAGMRAGDHDRFYATATVGFATVTVYESTVRPGGVTIEIDCWDNRLDRLSVVLNDREIHGQES